MEEAKKTSVELESSSRRNAVKKIVGGVSALAAYNLLPVRWEKPIIEQVFLPAHAQTSGVVILTLHDPCILTLISGNQLMPEAKVQVNGSIEPPTENLPVTITAIPEGGTGGPVIFNTTTNADGTFTRILTVTGGPGMTRINVQTHVEGSANDAVCALDLGIRQTPEEPPAEEECASYTIRIYNDIDSDLDFSWYSCRGIERETLPYDNDITIELSAVENTLTWFKSASYYQIVVNSGSPIPMSETATMDNRSFDADSTIVFQNYEPN